MQPEVINKKPILVTLKDLTAVFFENYSVSYITLTAIEKKGYFGCFKDSNFIPKLEARITEKAWKEIPANYSEVKINSYSFTENSFNAIVTVDCRSVENNTNKMLPKIIASFKARSTVLLNQFHGRHGRIFWENSYKEELVCDLNQLSEVLNRHK